MAEEALPTESPLWDAPNTVPTPHIADFRVLVANALVLKSLEAFLAGEPLTNLVSHWWFPRLNRTTVRYVGGFRQS